LIEQEEIPEAYSSEAQYEHLAFSFFEGHSLLALPFTDSQGQAVGVYTVDPDTGFQRAGTIRHDDLYSGYSPVLRRSLEIDDMLYTVSDAGLKANAFANLDEDVFEEIFPGFTPPEGCGGCFGDVCTACVEPAGPAD
jgi:hypothetical protein